MKQGVVRSVNIRVGVPLILASIRSRSLGIATGLPNLVPGLVLNPGFAFYFTAIVSLVTGTMFLMWLGEQITERGIGNGISIIIFTGIVAGLPSAVGQTAEQARQGDLHLLLLLLIGVVVFAVTYFVVFVERDRRRHCRVQLNAETRTRGWTHDRQQTFGIVLPLKETMAGLISAPSVLRSPVPSCSQVQSRTWVGTYRLIDTGRQLANVLPKTLRVDHLVTGVQPLYVMPFTATGKSLYFSDFF